MPATLKAPRERSANRTLPRRPAAPPPTPSVPPAPAAPPTLAVDLAAPMGLEDFADLPAVGGMAFDEGEPAFDPAARAIDWQEFRRCAEVSSQRLGTLPPNLEGFRVPRLLRRIAYYDGATVEGQTFIVPRDQLAELQRLGAAAAEACAALEASLRRER